jgi:hypothetical protein
LAFVLEATLATNQTDKELREEALFNKLFDEFDRLVESSDFFISIELRGTPKQQPSTTDIVAFLQKQLAGLDPDELTGAYLQYGHRALPKWTYPIDDGCYFEFLPVARKAEVRHLPNTRPLGAIGSEGYCVDDVAPIRKKILKKANRYGTLDRPYVIAVNLMSPTVERDDVGEALYGARGIWEGQRRADNRLADADFGPARQSSIVPQSIGRLPIYLCADCLATSV